MSVIATMTVSLDGYVTGPDDGPGCGLGVGGERLHYWVMGGPWTYETDHDFDAIAGPDKQFLDDLTATMGAAVCGRNMYEAAGAWGGTPARGPEQQDALRHSPHRRYAIIEDERRSHRGRDRPGGRATGATMAEAASGRACRVSGGAVHAGRRPLLQPSAPGAGEQSVQLLDDASHAPGGFAALDEVITLVWEIERRLQPRNQIEELRVDFCDAAR